jgi:hypothetical protein
MARRVDQHIAVSEAMCFAVAVCQLHQGGGNHAYMPLNEAHLPDTHLLQACTQCGVPITIWHIRIECPCSDKCQTFSWSGDVTWHPNRWLTWICSWYRGIHVFLSDSVLFFSLSHCVCIVSGISLGNMQPVCHILTEFLWFFILGSPPLLIRPL